MKKVIFTVLLLTATACTTPKTVLKNHQTGQVVMCGGSATGSMVGGVIGYHIQKSNDSDCVSTYIEQGFARVSQPEVTGTEPTHTTNGVVR